MSGKLCIPFAFVAFVMVCPVFGQGKPQPQPPNPYAGPPTFVEEQIPNGKAIIYLFSEPASNFVGLLALSKDGPIGVLKPATYLTFVTDPGKIRLYFTFESSVFVDLDVVAGQSYYVKATGGVLFGGLGDQKGVFTEIFSPEKAKQEDKILHCKKAEQRSASGGGTQHAEYETMRGG